MQLSIHKNIIEKLDIFLEHGKVPNIIFHGNNGSGKKYVLYQFIDKIYNNDNKLINKYVIDINCAHGKGIKFIREELKFFARTNIEIVKDKYFKTIILQNADKLTIDAQSALRRCIELYSHSTRFFIVVEDKYRLLKPILSRFCEIYIPYPIINEREENLYHYSINNYYKTKEKKNDKLKKLLFPSKFPCLFTLSNQLYEKGYSALDIIDFFEHLDNKYLKITINQKYKLLIIFQQIKKEFRNEKLLILIILNYILIRFDDTLENISIM